MRLQQHCCTSSSFAVPEPSLSFAQNSILKMGMQTTARDSLIQVPTNFFKEIKSANNFF
jgi:hypothetical protein